MPIKQLPHRCIAEKNMAESLELHVVRSFFAKAEKKSPFSDVSFLSLIHNYVAKCLRTSFNGVAGGGGRWRF